MTVAGKACLELGTDINVHSLHVLTGGVVSPKCDGGNHVRIQIQTDAIVDATSAIMADGIGDGPSAGFCGLFAGNGGSFGGIGGVGLANIEAPYYVYGSAWSPNDPGSRGGDGYQSAGGRGGGTIDFQVLGMLTLDGRISAGGTDGEGAWAGGGSGGSVQIDAEVLAGSGTISADGGEAVFGGGGGGGRVAIHFTENSFTGVMQALGGAGFNYGGAGTVFRRDRNSGSGGGNLVVDNAGNTGVTFLPPEDLGTGIDLAVSGGMTVLLGPDISLNSLHVGPAASVMPHTSLLTLYVQTDATIDAGGAICGDGKGCQPGQWAPGTGVSDLDRGGGGGGYGGVGGMGQIDTAGGAAYGSRAKPAGPGSCGGDGWQSSGGSGGAAVALQVDGTLTVNGTISANGLAGTGEGYGGGGSGGSIRVKVGGLAGSGTVQANGGSGSAYGGGGGGGRIAFSCLSNSFAGSAVAAGAEGYAPGEAGTIYWPGDINGDGYVNVGDLQALVAAWNSRADPPSSNWNADADLNNDGYVNIGDLQNLISHWNS